MQDNAPGHAARLTVEEFAELSIHPIYWPANSPDLNPIEHVWNEMKDWLSLNYPSRQATYDQLRQRVREALDNIGIDTLRTLVASMPDRCQAVIDASGKHTKY